MYQIEFYPVSVENMHKEIRNDIREKIYDAMRYLLINSDLPELIIEFLLPWKIREEITNEQVWENACAIIYTSEILVFLTGGIQRNSVYTKSGRKYYSTSTSLILEMITHLSRTSFER